MANEKAIIAQAAQKYGIDPKILWGLYGTETSFGKNVSTSSAGAVGPFQFLPSTAKGMGVNPYDFKSAAFGAARYLSQYKNRGVGGMLSAYNAGPGGGYQAGYVNTTLQNAKSFGGGPVSAPESAPAATQLPGMPQSQGFDQAGFQKAQKAAILGKLIASEGGAKDNPLFASGLVSTKAPDRSEYQLPGAPGATPSPAEPTLPPGKTVAYVNPLSGGFTKGRTDMGIDASATPGAPIRAMGNAKILAISPNWYKGQPYLSYELLDGPQRGKVIYVAEQIAPTVHPGQTVRAGETIARYAPSGTGIETGFGTRTPGQTLAQAEGRTGDSAHNNAPAGISFRRFLERTR